MAGVYHPRHPERTGLCWVLIVAEHEIRFEREYGFFRLIVKEIMKRYLDCGNSRCGFYQIRRPGCREDRLLMLFCCCRGYGPLCHAKRLEEWIMEEGLPREFEETFFIRPHVNIFYRGRPIGDKNFSARPSCALQTPAQRSWHVTCWLFVWEFENALLSSETEMLVEAHTQTPEISERPSSGHIACRMIDSKKLTPGPG